MIILNIVYTCGYLQLNAMIFACNFLRFPPSVHHKSVKASGNCLFLGIFEAGIIDFW